MSLIQNAKLALITFSLACTVSIAQAAPMSFVEEFNGPGLDAAWNQNGDPAGHPAAIAGSYDITDAHGAPGVELNRSTAGTLSSYTHEIEIVFDPFLLSGGGGTQADFKWKSFGADGFMEIVLNSFGDMRIFHNDFNGGAGDIQPNTNIGYTDGDSLKLTASYNQATDTIDFSYSLNAGVAVPFYSGGGVGGPIGDIITTTVNAEVFKWGTVPTQPIAAIDSWRLDAVVIPEPVSGVLLMSLCLGTLGCRRRA